MVCSQKGSRSDDDRFPGFWLRESYSFRPQHLPSSPPRKLPNVDNRKHALHEGAMIARFPAVLAMLALVCTSSLCSETWDGVVLPPEQQVEVDPASGAQVIFVTTHPGSDSNFYFHERCFLKDNQMMLFNSDRFGRAEVMGYLLTTGELIRLARPGHASLGSRVASVKGDRLYAVKSGGIYEWRLEMTTTPETRVRVTERKLTDLPDGAQQRSSLDGSSQGVSPHY